VAIFYILDVARSMLPDLPYGAAVAFAVTLIAYVLLCPDDSDDNAV
jgi:hypothetical protein